MRRALRPAARRSHPDPLTTLPPLPSKEYRLICKKGEGTFSEVLKAQCVRTGRAVAIKCMKSRFESRARAEALREVQALRRLPPHAHVVRLLDVLFDAPTGRLALVFELMDANLYELVRGRSRYLPEERVRSLAWQLLRAMEHLHRHGVFHR